MSDNIEVNDLLDFIKKATNEMEAEYIRIQKRAKEDPGTAGDQGEENWATLFRGWLPHTYHIVTKGRILFLDGAASPQVDVLILSQNYPKHLLDKKLYLAGGVVAAFECKLTLKPIHIKEAFQTSAMIRRHLPKRSKTPYRELNSSIIFGLLSHSHNWKTKRSKPIVNMKKNINASDVKYIEHPIEMVDLICVADLATWTALKAIVPKPSTAYVDDLAVGKNERNSTPIGTLLTHLLKKLAWEDITLQSLADYFSHAGVAGVGSGVRREWEFDILSDDIKNKIERGGLCNNVWDEWCIGFL